MEARNVSGARWILYGATGHTGALIVERALSRGHRPLLAGRNRKKLRELAEKHSLDHVCFDLTEEPMIRSVLTEYSTIVNVAGPYINTFRPIVEAAIATGTDYIDVCGELQVMEAMTEYHDLAVDAGVSLLPACGFEVVPSDALACYLSEKMPDATLLQLAICSDNRLSTGTMKAALAEIARGGVVRREGRLTRIRLGKRGPNVRFHQGERTTMSSPMPDLVTAWRRTGIPDIETYLAIPLGGGVSRLMAPFVSVILRSPLVRRVVSRMLGLRSSKRGRISSTKREIQHESGIGSFWCGVSNARGEKSEAWMRTGEPYTYTAKAVVRAVERLPTSRRPGLSTPSELFGREFAEEIEGERIVDRFPL